jgi:mutator protein MutT
MKSTDPPHETIIPVCAAALIRDGRLLVGRRNRGVADAGRWELPGGKLLPGEDPRECLAREILEEFGVRAQIGGLLDAVNQCYGPRNILLIVYRASIPPGELSSSDHDLLIWADPGRLAELDFLEADRPVVKRIMDELSGGGA